MGSESGHDCVGLDRSLKFWPLDTPGRHTSAPLLFLSGTKSETQGNRVETLIMTEVQELAWSLRDYRSLKLYLMWKYFLPFLPFLAALKSEMPFLGFNCEVDLRLDPGMAHQTSKKVLTKSRLSKAWPTGSEPARACTLGSVAQSANALTTKPVTAAAESTDNLCYLRDNHVDVYCS